MSSELSYKDADILTITEHLEKAAQTQPDKVAYEFIQNDFTVEKITYAELVERAKQIASHLLEMTEEGDRVLLIYPPGLDYILSFYSILFARRIAVPVYPPVKAEYVRTLQSIIDDCAPTAVLSSGDVISNIKKLKILKTMHKVPLIKKISESFMKSHHDLVEWEFESFRWINTDAFERAHEQRDLPKIQNDDIAFLQYTSGSTGQPKGVCVTHRNIYINQMIIKEAYGTDTNDTIVNWLPPYHDMGLIGSIMHGCYLGATTVSMSPLLFLEDPYFWLKTISSYDSCVSGGPNFAYNLCTHRVTEEQIQELDLSGWKVAFCGAEPIQSGVLARFAEQFSKCGFNPKAYYPCYGLAEATLFVATMSGLKLKEHVERTAYGKQFHLPDKIVSCGKPYVPLKIVNPDDFSEVEEGQIGEIAVGGPCITQSYWQKDNQSYPFIYIDGERFFMTGDVGLLEEAHLYVIGRNKESIIIAGRNYFPHDFESELTSEISLLRKGCCAVIGISHEGTESLIVVAEVKKTASNYEDITKQIKQLISKEYGLLVNQVYLLDEKKLLKTTSGKIRRVVMRDKILDGTLETIYVSPLEASISVTESNPLLAIIRDISGLSDDDDIDTSLTLMELGIDSLMYVELQARLQDRYPKHYEKIDFMHLSKLKNLEAGLAYMQSIDQAVTDEDKS